MGASFRNTGEILALAGCDFLTISPGLLKELAESKGNLKRVLDPAQASTMDLERVSFPEPAFRWALNEDAMATEKLSEGIRKFAEDGRKLAALLQTRLGQ